MFGSARSRIEALLRGQFLRSVAAVAGGTAAAQAIMILFSPITTRLYGPDAFGTLGAFNAAVAVLTPVATGAYSHAIALPAKDTVAFQIAAISLRIAFVLSIVFCLIVLFFGYPLATAVGLGPVAGYTWLLAIVFLVTGVEQVYVQWLVRRKQFRALGLIQAVHASGVGAANVTLGLLHPNALTLVISTTVGRLGKTLLLVLSARDSSFTREVADVLRSGDREARREVGGTFRDFPVFRAPQLLLNSISRNVPMLLFAGLFGTTIAGFYAISQRALQLPLAIVSQSVGKVILPRLAEAAQTGRPLRPLLIRSTLGLAAVGFLPFAVVFIYGPFLFGLVFGPGWSNAGLYARWLVPWLFFGFINVPIVQSLSITKSQHFLLLWEVVATAVKVATILAGAIVIGDVLVTIKAYSLVGAVMYLWLIVVGYRRAGIPADVRSL